ncbi:unnamed protein product [Rotaria magnacalcarata]|uniref:Uncharacterized protein n=2 Tax=Rotaria magnacalcarata TaxID=392030 RepID=A0A815TB01_9BILA|nr:unnamed protein product [Rotaria magnacalcarata]
MLVSILLILLIPNLIISVPYGTVSEAQLITNDIVSIWIYNQSSWSYCMCQALQFEHATIVAFNYFIDYQSCELIPNDPPSNGSYYMKSSSNSVIYIINSNFFNSLKSICCSDISWLLYKIQLSNTFNSVIVTQPVGLVLNADLNLFAIISGNERSIQLREASKKMTGKQFTSTETNAQPISYHDGIYFVGTNPSSSATLYNFYSYDANLTQLPDMYFPEGDPQRAVWLFNNSIVCLILQSDPRSILTFVNWNSSASNFTHNRTVAIPFSQPYGLAKSNDDAIIYVSGDKATIYQLSTNTFTWSILVPNYNSTEIPMSLAVDSCGNRLWVLMLGFGIRIYDRIYGNEIASWNMSMSYPTLYDMILTSDYELYLIDKSMNQLIHYGLSLTDQCTINLK